MPQNTPINSTFLDAQQICWGVKDKLILDRLSFQVAKGEFVGVIGPNGAGKSSLLRCLYGKNKIDSGHIHLEAKNLDQYSRRELAQQVAVVLQEPPTRFDLSVLDVVRMGLTPNKSLFEFDSADDFRLITKAATQVDLADKLLRPFNSLSGGEKQRAMIARAILQSPRLLIMDEPTNHLDIRHQIEVLELAKTMQITVLVSIHDLNLATAYCDRLILLDKGRIIAQGTPAEVITESCLQQVFGVKAQVDQHPFNQKLRITFAVGRQQ